MNKFHCIVNVLRIFVKYINTKNKNTIYTFKSYIICLCYAYDYICSTDIILYNTSFHQEMLCYIVRFHFILLSCLCVESITPNRKVWKKRHTYFSPWGIIHSSDQIMVLGVLDFKETISHFFS